MADEIFNKDPNSKIGKQIVLPFSRAVEISMKSLKIRFWRSLITISSIVLAIAFLSSILVNTTLLRALKTGPDRAVREAELAVKSAGSDANLEASKAELTRLRMVRDKVNVALLGEGGTDDTETAEKQEVAGNPEGWQSFFGGLKAKDYWLISLALLVCFVGIVNAMLMSVTERFREIGTMKCLGALDSFIVKLFLLESVFQGALGTAMGIFVGALLSVIRAWWLYGAAVFSFFPWGGFLLCIVLAQGVGTVLSIVASVFPARAAARMQPVDALRAEQ